MKRAKIFMISCWLFFLVGTPFAFYLSQGFSSYFPGNQYLIVSIFIYIPLFVLAILALHEVISGYPKNRPLINKVD